MAERGLDISGHRARQLTPELIRSFELILVMEKDQQRAVEVILPSARGRVQCIGHWGGFDVQDPYRQGRPAFERSLALIERGLGDLERAFWPAATLSQPDRGQVTRPPASRPSPAGAPRTRDVPFGACAFASTRKRSASSPRGMAENPS